MTVQCVECVHLSRKDTPREFRNLNFLRCLKGGVGEFVSPEYPRTCKKFAQAPAAEVEGRRRWLNRSGGAAKAAESINSNTATP